jgi:hypothetical protein
VRIDWSARGRDFPMRFCLWHDRGYHYHHWLRSIWSTAMMNHKAGRWLVGVFVVATMAFGVVGVGSGRTLSEYEWNAPVSQFVAR